MSKRMTLPALLVLAVAAVVWAGDTKKDMAGSPMEAMKAEMMKCSVCKHIGMHMDEIGPMGSESIQLNDGVMIRHWVKSSDPKKIEAFHAACGACSKAGEESMALTDDKAKAELCGFCLGIRAAVKAGAHMSQGMTKDADVMVMTSSDPAVQSQLAELHKQCQMMMAAMEAPSGKASAEK